MDYGENYPKKRQSALCYIEKLGLREKNRIK